MTLLWGDQQLPDSSFKASSVYNDLFMPQFAVLDGHPLDITAGSWNPAIEDKKPFIQVELPEKTPVYGVVMQGSPLYNHFVTSYEVMYGDDGNVFSPVETPDGNPQIFRGPVDHKNQMKQMFDRPFEAKFVRILPLTWHEEIAVRFELIGCKGIVSTTSTAAPTTPSTAASTTVSTAATTTVSTAASTTTSTSTSTTITTTTTVAPEILETTSTTLVYTTPEPLQCTEPLGISAGLPIEMIEVSSHNEDRQYLTLNSTRGWQPLYSTPGEWIMFNFTSPRKITGIKTKGGTKGWVSAFNIMYTTDLTTFNPVLDTSGAPKLFPANFDEDTLVMNEFRPPLNAQYLKVLPIKWQNSIEIRVEPVGCFEPYPVTKAPKSDRALAPCELCPGVPTTSSCKCGPTLYYDGENCVTRDQCPCMVGFISYTVGSMFRGDNCDECICKLGGITDCRPVTQCVCKPDLVPKLSPSCECLCEPCSNGTKICPTSKLCLPTEKWCDGLQDCPDDERDCAVVTETAKTIVVHTEAATKPTTTLATTPVTTLATTEKPLECPKVECPPGYFVKQTTKTHSSYSSADTDLPPPRPRYSYQRFRKGGYAKGGFSKGGFSKTGFSKGGYSKGGRNGLPAPPRQTQAFTLEKPTSANTTKKQECVQFKCVPNLPPPYRPGVTPKPVECSTPVCPRHYTLKLESVPDEINKCPQYICVPPVERPAFCNVTGRTFTTFDGTEYKYDVCYHILARDNKLGAWTVLIRKKCRLEGCMNELLVLQDDQLILVKPNLMIEYDNYEYTVEQTSKICFQKNSFDVFRQGKGIAIKSRKYLFFVMYSPDGDVKIGVHKKYMGSVDGLCGLFDGDASNDRTLPDGTLATSISQFARSWAKPGLPPDACQTKVIPPQKQKRVWDLCNVITEKPLSECAKVLNLDKWRNICLEKICECAELATDGIKRTEEECRCLLLEQLVAECLAADKNIDVSTWRIQNGCRAECPPPLVHYDCYRKGCEPACGAPAQAQCPQVEGQCFPGCYCPEGTLRKEDRCLAPHDCIDCVCTGLGTPAKYVTFEGDDLPFLGNCTYLASRDRSETGQHKYQVYSSNGPCEESKDAVCTKIVHLMYGTNIIHVTKDPHTKKLVTTVNGRQVFRYPFDNEWAVVSLVYGQDVSIMLPDLHVELQVTQSMLEFSVRLPSHLYGNRTEGLCGVCAGYQEHLVTSNGTVTDDFELYGKSWKASPEVLASLEVPPQEQCGEVIPEPECVPLPPEVNPCYNLHNVDKFGPCHALVDPESYIESCQRELCDLNSTNACPSLERYADECRRQGICLDWRSGLCPTTCEAPLVHRACVDCERTCENYEEFKKDPASCRTPPAEGCFCPQGLVRVNSTCIEPSKCFPCDSNSEHYAGDEWQEDACTKCTCSRVGEQNAAHVACTTQVCSVPVCLQHEDLVKKAVKPSACCPEYMCVPKPTQPQIQCEEAKKMDCGFGQVLKQKINSNGCQEFACECKPASECEVIPDDSQVEMLEPGVERVVDNSGCCPKVELLCRADKCPRPHPCPEFHTLEVRNITGKCCPEYNCELPKDKCVVTVEWEAAASGGEKSRPEPLRMIKDLDESWTDGPCRSCRCVSSAGARDKPSPQCSVTQCPAAVSEQYVTETRPVPFACCPRHVHVAC
ncbi:unnamed protein product [Leptidea sinapis]|uniref:Hemocytin n=1 Tax=Leptidea sinapis TaxID=189913 RepID=A0A5E4QX83_9NEOP|nr:unnamed protein product [Leptidea sinapis]